VRALVLDEPVAQAFEFARRRSEALDVLLDLLAVGDASARHDGASVNVQAGAPRMQDFHGLLQTSRRGALAFEI
jgi:hypothetical protein